MTAWKNDIYDIVTIGLGPAGAVFCMGLSREFSVLAIDGKSETGKFRKPCGGLLAPDAQKALALLGLNLPKSVLVDPQIFSVRTIDLDSGLTRSYQRMYINIDRHRFDLWLMSQLPENVERACGTAVSIEREDGLYRVGWKENGELRFARARYLVGADGAKSLTRHFISPGYKCRSYMAVQQWFRDENPAPFYSCIFDSGNTDCYSWSVSKDGSFIFGGAYPKRFARAAFERQKSRLSEMGFVFGEPIRTEACLVLRPTGLGSFCTGRENVFLIGEAAGFVSPSSLEGISSAVISGAALARVIGGRSPDKQREYRKAVRGLCLRLAAKNLKCPFMYSPPLRRLVLKTGISTLNVRRINYF